MIVRQLPSLFLKDASGPPVSPSGKIRRIPQESSRESSQQNPCSAQTLISITFHINVRPVVRLSKTPLVGLPWEQNRATLLRYVRFAQRESVRGAKPDPNRRSARVPQQTPFHIRGLLGRYRSFLRKHNSKPGTVAVRSGKSQHSRVYDGFYQTGQIWHLATNDNHKA